MTHYFKVEWAGVEFGLIGKVRARARWYGAINPVGLALLIP